jgi:hypothetical protein
MKTKLLNVLLAQEAIRNINKSHASARLAFSLARITSAMRQVAQDFEDIRQPLIDEYFYLPLTDGTRQPKSGEAFNQFTREIDDLLQADVELPGINPIQFKNLEPLFEPESGPVNGREYMTIADLSALLWLVEDAPAEE